jgi:hypothetical protein
VNNENANQVIDTDILSFKLPPPQTELKNKTETITEKLVSDGATNSEGS